MTKIGCVLVLYNPNIELTKIVLEKIIPQVELVCIIDNSTQSDSKSFFKQKYDNCHYISMNGNAGIAEAQNVGIKYLISQNFDHVLFLDQDSIAPANMVGKLADAISILCKNNIKVGGLGPRLENRESGDLYTPLVSKGSRYSKNLVEVSEIISSGSLVPVKAFLEVGGFDAYFFIDGVDHEWCWRAKASFWRFFISDEIVLSHQLGEGDKSFLFIKNINIPAPIRCYYLYRNYLIMLRYPYVPLYWKVSRFIILFSKFLYLSLFISPRRLYVSNILKGLRDGLKSHKYITW